MLSLTSLFGPPLRLQWFTYALNGSLDTKKIIRYGCFFKWCKNDIYEIYVLEQVAVNSLVGICFKSVELALFFNTTVSLKTSLIMLQNA